MGNRKHTFASVIAFALLGATACSSEWGGESPACGSCQGNTAIECGVVPTCDDVTVYVEDTKMSVDCGSKKCTVTKDTRQCTDQGAQRTVQKTVAACK